MTLPLKHVQGDGVTVARGRQKKFPRGGVGICLHHLMQPQSKPKTKPLVIQPLSCAYILTPQRWIRAKIQSPAQLLKHYAKPALKTRHAVPKVSEVARAFFHVSAEEIGLRKPSHVTRHTSHVTHHTSHVTHQTSHVTRHTSHVTQHGHRRTLSPISCMGAPMRPLGMLWLRPRGGGSTSDPFRICARVEWKECGVEREVNASAMRAEPASTCGRPPDAAKTEWGRNP
jgi:hypothetical protein